MFYFVPLRKNNVSLWFIYTGNHESTTMNQMYGFEGEVKEKYPLHGSTDFRFCVYVLLFCKTV